MPKCFLTLIQIPTRTQLKRLPLKMAVGRRGSSPFHRTPRARPPHRTCEGPPCAVHYVWKQNLAFTTRSIGVRGGRSSGTSPRRPDLRIFSAVLSLLPTSIVDHKRRVEGSGRRSPGSKVHAEGGENVLTGGNSSRMGVGPPPGSEPRPFLPPCLLGRNRFFSFRSGNKQTR